MVLVLVKVTKSKITSLIFIFDIWKFLITFDWNFDINLNKVCQSSNILVNIMKEYIDVFGHILCTSFNNSTKATNFSRNLKLADTAHLQKKSKKCIKGNYRPVCKLPNSIVKVYFFAKYHFLFKVYLFGLRKSLSAEQCLLEILKKWKKSVDNGKSTDSWLTGLLKVLDGLDDKLFIVKVWTYGFNMAALKLIHDCLWNKKQQTKINSSYSG